MEENVTTTEKTMIQKFRSIAMKWGLIAGVASVIYTLMLYVIDAKLMVSMWATTGAILTIVFMVLAVKEIRTSQGGFISLSEALFGGFFVYVIGLIVSTIFNYALMTWIDPNLPVLLQETVLETTVEMMQRFGASEDDISKALEGMTDNKFELTPMKMFTNFLAGSAFGFVIAFVIALIMKKRRPIFE